MKTIFSSLSFFLFCFTVNAQDWTVITSGTTQNLNKIHFVNDSVGFIIGDNGTLLKTVNSGLNWETITTNISENLTTITFANDQIGYINGLKTTDGGITWQSQNSTELYSVLYALDPNTLIGGSALSFDGQIWKSTDGAVTWSSVASPISTGFYTDIEFSSLTVGYMTSWYSGHLIKTTDGGLNWSILLDNSSTPSINDSYSVRFPTPDTGVLTSSDNIYKTTDAGTNWSSIFPTNGNSTFRPNGTFSLDQNHYIVVGMDEGTSSSKEKIYQTTDGGNNWAIFNSNSPNLNDVYCTSTTCFAVGENGTILSSDNTLSIMDFNQGKENISLYPNPSNNLVNINTQNEISKVIVYGALGQFIEEIPIKNNQFSVNNLSNGIYYLSIISTDNSVQTSKLVKE